VVEMAKVYKILIGKPETKNPFAKSSLRCGDISKMDLKREREREREIVEGCGVN